MPCLQHRVQLKSCMQCSEERGEQGWSGLVRASYQPTSFIKGPNVYGCGVGHVWCGTPGCPLYGHRDATGSQTLVACNLSISALAASWQAGRVHTTVGSSKVQPPCSRVWEGLRSRRVWRSTTQGSCPGCRCKNKCVHVGRWGAPFRLPTPFSRHETTPHQPLHTPLFSAH